MGGGGGESEAGLSRSRVSGVRVRQSEVDKQPKLEGLRKSRSM